MKCYWWKLPDQVNFGDDMNQLILRKLNLDYEWADPFDAELVMCGSVLEHLPQHWAGTVCGAGKLHENSGVHLGGARVFAVRGKLTRSGVTGLKKDVALGDPALLVSRWIRQPQAKYDLGIVPHWSDYDLHRRFPYGRFIDPCQPAEKVVEEIASCKAIISSSLHGIIVADAFGIPRQAELFPDANSIHEGGDFKFCDYASVFDESPQFGRMHLVSRDKVERVQNDLYRALEVATGIDLPDPDQRRDPQMSILVPFRDDGEHRGRVWRWLRRYWRARGMDAEIIQGHDFHQPFSKAVAVNQAALMARGRVLVILDADTYLAPEVLTGCVTEIETALRHGRQTWYMPYDRLYRLNKETTDKFLLTNPLGPAITARPAITEIEMLGDGKGPYWPYDGHQYGAMAQIIPREAFIDVGGMDPRFRGWGSEDVSLLRALDTLWGHHEVAENQVLHLWHARIGSKYTDRQWVGQSWGAANSRLAQRYAGAIAEPGYMAALAAEHPLGL